MQARSGRPHTYGHEVAFLRAQAVDKTPRHEVGYGVDERKDTRHVAVVGIGPVELGGDKVFPCKRQHLAVHVVDSSCQEQHSADNPPEVGHPLYDNLVSHFLRFRFKVLMVFS